jgi:hypothetical protein
MRATAVKTMATAACELLRLRSGAVPGDLVRQAAPMTMREPHSPLPDGIDEAALGNGAVARHASVLSLIVLGAVMAVGMSGWTGGRAESRLVDNDAVQLTITAPAVIRNGNIMETRLQLVAHQRIDKLVIGVEPGLWRELTTNTTLPSASAESYRDGLLRFEFDALDAGRAFEWQLAHQVNPSRVGVNRGRLVILDDRRELAGLPLTLRVLP